MQWVANAQNTLFLGFRPYCSRPSSFHNFKSPLETCLSVTSVTASCPLCIPASSSMIDCINFHKYHCGLGLGLLNLTPRYIFFYRSQSLIPASSGSHLEAGVSKALIGTVQAIDQLAVSSGLRCFFRACVTANCSMALPITLLIIHIATQLEQIKQDINLLQASCRPHKNCLTKH